MGLRCPWARGMASAKRRKSGARDATREKVTRMFAVMKTGGKQYRVAQGEIVLIEKLVGEVGDRVQFNQVLMVGGDELSVGAPLVADAAVQAEVLEQARGPKVVSYIKRRRKHSSQRKRGHRQRLTRVRITGILATGAEKSGMRDAHEAAPAADAE